MFFVQLVKCMFGPKLYRIRPFEEEKGHIYKPSNMEILCQTVITLTSSIMLVTIYSLPLIIVYFYKCYGLAMLPTCIAHLALWFTGAGAVLGPIFVIRALERWTNQDYYDFSKHIQNSLSLIWAPIKTSEKLLSRYDFEYSYWPADFKMPKGDQNMKQQNIYKSKSNKPNIISMMVYKFILKVYVFICLKRAGYNPKTVFNGRTNLIENENYNGQRYKLLTIDNNQIDCLFIDRRNDLYNTKGGTLVISCEGIAGHYECGICCTPLRAGYSVLGWNHPGFGESTGTLFPEEDANAIEVVVKFANETLDFKFENIILFGWSYGGHAASWASMRYPKLKGIILDATFDDFQFVFNSKLPKFLPKSSIQKSIQKYFNMDNSKNLAKYNGPVLIIRRTRDEKLCINKAKPIESNRTNFLLIKLFQERFPDLMADEESYYAFMSWLASNSKNQKKLFIQHQVDEKQCLKLLKSLIPKDRNTYPIPIGDIVDSEIKVQLVLFLASKHFVEHDSTHNEPLPVECFLVPWNLFSNIN